MAPEPITHCWQPVVEIKSVSLRALRVQIWRRRAQSMPHHRCETAVPKMSPNRLNPLGTRGLQDRSTSLVVDDSTASPPPPALIVLRKTPGFDLLDYDHGRLGYNPPKRLHLREYALHQQLVRRKVKGNDSHYRRALCRC